MMTIIMFPIFKKKKIKIKIKRAFYLTTGGKVDIYIYIYIYIYIKAIDKQRRLLVFVISLSQRLATFFSLSIAFYILIKTRRNTKKGKTHRKGLVKVKQFSLKWDLYRTFVG